MPSIPKSLRPWLEPVGGAVFFTLWVIAEAGRLYPFSLLIVLAAYSLAIAVTRVLPLVGLLVVLVVPGLQLAEILPRLTSTSWPVYIATLFVAFLIALHAQATIRWIALGFGVIQAAMVALLLVLPSRADPYGWTSWTGQSQVPDIIPRMFIIIGVTGLGLYAAAWTAGLAVRLNVKQLHGIALLRRTSADLGVAEFELRFAKERDRIAQDVHDVLAHSLAVVIALADGSRFLSKIKPESTDTALRDIADTARSALVDVRGLVEGLRDEPGDRPQPGLSDLDALTKRVSSAGMHVSTEHFGDAQTLTPAQELAVFRIIQESLTNSLKHAGPQSTARISFDWRGPGLALAVTSRGDEHPLDQASTLEPHTGHGIRGMKDRARLAGGWLTTGWTDAPEALFLVTAFIPTEARDGLETNAALRATS